jgi:competence ComEA-like helix-hairpin-helix protein
MRLLWQRLVDYLALTATERKVILFLVGSLLLGLSVKIVLPEVQQQPVFEYGASDSTFAALSAVLKSDTLTGTGTIPDSQGKLNLNTATDAQLESLPGIGAVLAERIIRHREMNGMFTSADELLKIKGMTKKRLEQIKDFITIDRQ